MISVLVKFLTTVKNLLMSRNNNSCQEGKKGNKEGHRSLVSVHKRHVFIDFRFRDSTRIHKKIAPTYKQNISNPRRFFISFWMKSELVIS